MPFFGDTKEDLSKPLIGVVNAQNEIIPGHIHLDQVANAVKSGIWAAGGTPIEFPLLLVFVMVLLWDMRV